jgi:hypothetical protein
MTHLERCECVRHCRWVDEVVADAPWIINQEFIDEHQIDYVAHDEDPYAGSDGSKDIYQFVKDQGTCASPLPLSFCTHLLLQANSSQLGVRPASRPLTFSIASSQATASANGTTNSSNPDTQTSNPPRCQGHPPSDRGRRPRPQACRWSRTCCRRTSWVQHWVGERDLLPSRTRRPRRRLHEDTLWVARIGCVEGNVNRRRSNYWGEVGNSR